MDSILLHYNSASEYVEGSDKEGYWYKWIAGYEEEKISTIKSASSHHTRLYKILLLKPDGNKRSVKPMLHNYKNWLQWVSYPICLKNTASKIYISHNCRKTSLS